MTRAPTRTSFTSSALIRALSDLALLNVAEPGSAFAEQLSAWLNLHDAIALRSVLSVSVSAASTAAPPVDPTNLGDELARLRATLTHAITVADGASGNKRRIDLPPDSHGMSDSAAAAFEPYRRYYLAHQRDMDTSIGVLRIRARDVLTKTSRALAKLAALDGVFDATLTEREGRLLSKIPALLEKRFDQLRKAHQQALADVAPAVTGAQSITPGSWVKHFCRDMQAVLLAELDVRLQPTLGLVEAYNQELCTP